MKRLIDKALDSPVGGTAVYVCGLAIAALVLVWGLG